ncbi:MAG: ATPase domain-containing protein [Candidatus Methanoperedens sp.]|nr:ATPase domain-containing protein [Candidatus Methanoperedens sp.]
MLERSSKLIQRVSSGIEGLDDILGGGFPEGHVVVVIGDSGTGKTTMVLQYIMEGLLKNEPGLYITIEEDKESIIATAKAYGWDMEKYIKENKLALLKLDISDMKATARQIKSELPGIIKTFGTKRLVIDSITLFSMIFDDATERRIRLVGLIKAIKKAGITALFTAEVNADNTLHSKDGIVEYSSDGVILLQQNEFDTSIKLMTRVVKMRRIRHDRLYRPYEITDKGLVVFSNEMVFHEVGMYDVPASARKPRQPV